MISLGLFMGILVTALAPLPNSRPEQIKSNQALYSTEIELVSADQSFHLSLPFCNLK